MKPTKKQLAESKYLAQICKVLNTDEVNYIGKDQFRKKELFYISLPVVNDYTLIGINTLRILLMDKIKISITPAFVINKVYIQIIIDL